jgi:hypothetical protein
MKDYNTLLSTDTEIIEASLEMLTGDDKINYLYFLRDEINKQIKKAKA